MIKKRTAKISNRGIYIQDRELLKTVFKPSTHFKYVIDINNRQVVIEPTKDAERAKNRVSKRQLKDTVKPVIDIRDKRALEVFKGSTLLEIEIDVDRIIVTGINEEKVVAAAIDKSSLEEYTYQQSSMFKHVFKVCESIIRVNPEFKIPLEIISLFCCSGQLDEGFLQAGFDIKLALEKDLDFVNTYRLNNRHPIVNADITNFDKSIFGEIGAPIYIAGTPCQGLSQSNRYTNYLDNPNNKLVLEYIQSIQQNPSCKVWVWENVPGILTMGRGKFKAEIYEQLSDFEITEGVLCASDFGSPQVRKRAILIGSKIGRIELPKPTHETPVSISEAWEGLHNGIPNQTDYTQPKEETIKKMRHIAQGENWQSIPEHLRSQSMDIKKTHSNLYRRLEANKPSITLANIRKSNILHPTEHRSLSIRESARLFDVSDDFHFVGSLSKMQQMVCNAVPVKMAKAIANVVKDAIEKYNQKFVYGY